MSFIDQLKNSWKPREKATEILNELEEKHINEIQQNGTTFITGKDNKVYQIIIPIDKFNETLKDDDIEIYERPNIVCSGTIKNAI